MKILLESRHLDSLSGIIVFASIGQKDHSPVHHFHSHPLFPDAIIIYEATGSFYDSNPVQLAIGQRGRAVIDVTGCNSNEDKFEPGIESKIIQEALEASHNGFGTDTIIGNGSRSAIDEVITKDTFAIRFERILTSNEDWELAIKEIQDLPSIKKNPAITVSLSDSISSMKVPLNHPAVLAFSEAYRRTVSPFVQNSESRSFTQSNIPDQFEKMEKMEEFEKNSQIYRNSQSQFNFSQKFNNIENPNKQNNFNNNNINNNNSNISSNSSPYRTPNKSPFQSSYKSPSKTPNKLLNKSPYKSPSKISLRRRNQNDIFDDLDEEFNDDDMSKFDCLELKAKPQFCARAIADEDMGYPLENEREDGKRSSWIRVNNSYLPPILAIGAGFFENKGKAGEFLVKDHLLPPIATIARFPSLYRDKK